MIDMELRYLMTIAVEAMPPASLGMFPIGERRLTAFTGGTFNGADGLDLTGTIAPGGVDWQIVRSDATIELRAHYLLVTDKDESIEVESNGIRVMSPEVVARFAKGEPLEPSEYYFRSHIRLSTGSPRLAHLNNRIAVSTGERRQKTVLIHIHDVL